MCARSGAAATNIKTSKHQNITLDGDDVVIRMGSYTLMRYRPDGTLTLYTKWPWATANEIVTVVLRYRVTLVTYASKTWAWAANKCWYPIPCGEAGLTLGPDMVPVNEEQARPVIHHINRKAMTALRARYREFVTTCNTLLKLRGGERWDIAHVLDSLTGPKAEKTRQHLTSNNNKYGAWYVERTVMRVVSGKDAHRYTMQLVDSGDPTQEYEAMLRLSYFDYRPDGFSKAFDKVLISTHRDEVLIARTVQASGRVPPKDRYPEEK